MEPITIFFLLLGIGIAQRVVENKSSSRYDGSNQRHKQDDLTGANHREWTTYHKGQVKKRNI